MDNLLPHYERELGLLRRYAREFAEHHPKIAGKLLIAGEVCEDPHIERMIQSFALLNARMSTRLDDDFPEFTEALFEVLYPHFLRPFPSCSIVRFDYRGLAETGKLSAASTIPRGTELKTSRVNDVECQFNTAYDVTVAPVALRMAKFDAILTAPTALLLPPTATSKISMSIETCSDRIELAQLDLTTLRVFIDGEPGFCGALKDALFIRPVRAYLEFPADGRWMALDQIPIKAVGFANDEALLAFPERSHAPYRLLTELFTFPEKFNFFDIDLQAISSVLPQVCRQFTLHLALAGPHSNSHPARVLGTLSSARLLLGCTPAINAFRQPGVPIALTPSAPPYPVMALARNPCGYEVLAIDSLDMAGTPGQGPSSTSEVRPLHALRHGEASKHGGCYWVWRRGDEMALNTRGYQAEIAIVDVDGKPAPIQTGTLNVALTCSNRDLPCSLPYGLPEGDLSMQAGAIKYPIRFLRKPSPPQRFERGRGAHWRLISHLSLNYLSLETSGLEALREMLTLHDLSGSAVARRQIGGIVALRRSTTTAWLPGDMQPGLVRGLELRLVIDEEAFAASGIHGFAHVMERFFGLYIHTTSFTRLIIVSQGSGDELLRCSPRAGALSLL